jgi:hypothetical protein
LIRKLTSSYASASPWFTLTLGIFLALIAIAAVSLFEGRRQAIRQAQSEASKIVQLAGSYHEVVIEEAEQFLTVLSEVPQARAKESGCSEFLADLLKKFPHYSNIGVAGTDGQVTCSGLPTPEPVNVADRAYFQRAVESRSFSVGEYQIGRITNKATINFALPILLEDKLDGVLFVALDLYWLNRYLSYENLGRGVKIAVVDGQGVVLSIHPSNPEVVGQPSPDQKVIEAIFSNKEAGTTETKKDGVREYYAFAPLRGTDDAYIYVRADVSSERILEEMWQIAKRMLIGLIGVISLLFLLAVLWDSFLHRTVLKPRPLNK